MDFFHAHLHSVLFAQELGGVGILNSFSAFLFLHLLGFAGINMSRSSLLNLALLYVPCHESNARSPKVSLMPPVATLNVR